MDLYKAAGSGDVETTRHLLDSGADINAQGGYFGTALQAAAKYGNPETIRLLLDAGADINAQGGYYGTALQTAASDGNPEIIRLLLDAGADINAQGGHFGTAFHAAIINGNAEVLDLFFARAQDFNLRDTLGRTLLHVAAEERSLSAVTRLLAKGTNPNISDYLDIYPLQLATQTDHEIAERLLAGSSKEVVSSIAASTWRSLLPGPGSHLHMVQDEDQRTSVKKVVADIENMGYPLSKGQNVVESFADFMRTGVFSTSIFILGDGSLLSSLPTGACCRLWRHLEEFGTGRWKVQSSTIPSPAALAQIPENSCFVDCSFVTRAIALPDNLADWPRLSNEFKLERQKFDKTCGIAWYAIVARDSNGTSKLESRTFFSTSEYAQVPSDVQELFVPLVQQLQDTWTGTFEAAESRLAQKRTELLRSNGTERGLIRNLLSDAQVWDLLERCCRVQIAELRKFDQVFSSKQWAVIRGNTGDGKAQGEDMKPFRDAISNLDKEYSRGLKILADASNDLIQLEFNLTSIAEAQRSASTNKSMKRLSWITFIFLPLMFIASLFGMNIDLLASNPPWWIYPLIAIGTTSLTLTIWLIFKYNSSLEKRIEDGFDRLLRRNRRPLQDVERGNVRAVSPQRRAGMFSAFGKKRS